MKFYDHLGMKHYVLEHLIKYLEKFYMPLFGGESFGVCCGIPLEVICGSSEHATPTLDQHIS